MINFILSYFIFGWFHYNGVGKSMRPLMYLCSEPLLVYTDDTNRLHSIFIYTLMILNFIEFLHYRSTMLHTSITRVNLFFSLFLRLSYFFYCIYYIENIRNIIISIYLILQHMLDDENYRFSDYNKINFKYNILDGITKLILLYTYPTSFSWNLDPILIGGSLFFSFIFNL